jgi:hypothetical protein
LDIDEVFRYEIRKQKNIDLAFILFGERTYLLFRSVLLGSKLVCCCDIIFNWYTGSALAYEID